MPEHMKSEQGNDSKKAAIPAGKGAHAGGFSYRGDTDDEYPDALESLEPHLEPALLNDDEPMLLAEKPAARHGKDTAETAREQGEYRTNARGAGGKGVKENPPYLHKSRRMRKFLIAVIVLLVVLLGALGYFAFQFVQESQLVATQQTQQRNQRIDEADSIKQEEMKDTQDEAKRQTTVPNLVALLGLTQDEAIEKLQHGATASALREVNEEGNPIKSTVNVALTSEPADTRSGTPTVYLGMDEAGLIVQAGYSASTTVLGYGTLSFSDAVKNEGIVEKTLREAGVNVPEGTVQLPTDKSQYSTYASDGTTLVKENCSFSGDVDIDGTPHEWSAVLSYDYTTANASGNLADTIRTIYVYVNA